MNLSAVIGMVLLLVCLCVGIIAISLNTDMGGVLAERLDATDAFYGILFLFFVFSVSGFKQR